MIRIAVTGPESSGKSTLCQALSEYYKVEFITEFARGFLEDRNGIYVQSDLDEIGKGQLNLIQSSKENLIISDTDFSVLEVWSQYKYGETSKLIHDLVSRKVFDLHILCSPDIPWEEDPLRENPHNRDELFKMYLTSLKQHNKNFIVVSGTYSERIEKSLKSIDLL